MSALYYGTAEVTKIEGDVVTLSDGTELLMNEKARDRRISGFPNESADAEEEKKATVALLGIVAGADVAASLDAGTLAENQTKIVAEIVKTAEKEGYELDTLQKAFHNLQSVIRSLHNITVNNLATLQEDVIVKALGLEKSGKTNGERMRAMNLNHLAKFLKNG